MINKPWPVLKKRWILDSEGSMLALAQMYQQGRGVVQNTVKARLLYAQAGFDPTELADHS
jgi:hypothetical protein